jgi:uncharacterized protein DUF4189
MVCTPDSPGAPGSSAPRASYGAIAYGATSGAFGYSYHWGSQAEAERVAMKNCVQHGDDYQVLVWFDRRCGAVVSGGNATAFWGLGADAAGASTDAENKCTQGGATDCVIQVTQCSM